MKKLMVFAVIAMVAGMVSAQTLEGIGNSYIYNVENDEWYRASGPENAGWANLSTTVFDSMDFGIVSSLTLGGQAQTWQGASPNTTVTMFWEVFEGAASQASGDMNLSWLNNTGGEFGNNSTWENMTGQNVAAGLASGTEYTVAVWFNAVQDGTTTVWDSNSSANYVASFETAAAPIPEPATMSLLGLGALAMVLRRKIRK